MLTIPRDTLARVLQRAQGFCTTGTTNPALSCVLLTTRAGSLIVQATNTLTACREQADATVETEGEVLVNASALFQFVRGLPPGEVSVKMVGGGRLRVSGGRTVGHLNTLSTDEFPPTGSADGELSRAEIKASDLARLIDRGAYAMALDGDRYGLNGIYAKSYDKDGASFLKMVSTDGSRLAECRAPLVSGKVTLERTSLLQGKALAEVRKMLSGDDVWTLVCYQRRIEYVGPGIRISARHVEGEFPDYEAVIPESCPRVFTVERGFMLAALKRILLFANDRNHSAGVSFEANRAVITGESLDLGDGREEVDGSLSGEPIKIGFNAHLLIEGVNAMGGRGLEFNMGVTALDPVILKSPADPNSMAIVMPMRLD